MTIIELIRQLLPNGTDAFAVGEEPAASHDPVDHTKCPTWPPDLFAVVGSIIDRSGCYTLASPDREALAAHHERLKEISICAQAWNDTISAIPATLQVLWTETATTYADVRLASVSKNAELVSILLILFAAADEASVGMGWDVDPGDAERRKFASVAFAALTRGDAEVSLPYESRSLCVMVPAEQTIVLPKSITSSVGCTIRSLSHHLALLPPVSVLEPRWILSSKKAQWDAAADPAAPYPLRLLLVPFPFTIHASSFKLSSRRQKLGTSENSVPAYFELLQNWLEPGGEALTAERLATQLILRLIDQARNETGSAPHGVILPECALSTELAGQLADALAGAGIDFLITGSLDTIDGKHRNRALTFVYQEDGRITMDDQNKHHRWRLDRGQTERYGLDFDNDHENNQWWEDIDVNERKLPFFGLRKDMSLATLICEDLARTDPAMTAIRAVGPNLVVALLMDGPQLAVRWPGRYATVLAEDPGSAVLSFTCAAMVDRSNWVEAKPARSIGLWRDGGGRTQEIGLPEDALGVMLTLQSKRKHQNTLDNRSDNSLSRQLILRTVVPLFLADRPTWI